jgi:CheY-like chemotaxis protein
MDLNPLLERTCTLLGQILDDRTELRMEPESGLPTLQGDPGQLETMLLRLGLLEAEALVEKGGTLCFRTRLHPGGRPVLELRRNPASFAAGGDPARRRGSLREILAATGAELLEDGPENGGWALAVLLPAGAAGLGAAIQSVHPPFPRLEGLRVLVAEDEPEIRGFLEEALGSLGAEVVTAVDGADGWRSWSARGPFDLLLTDQRMPGLTGMGLLQRIRSERPRFPAVVMSGYGLEEFAEALDQDPHLLYLAKPFMLPALLEAIGRLLRRAGPGA